MVSNVGSFNDSSTSTATCTTGGAAAGLAVGGALGYLKKPWLLNGEPSDAFVKAVDKALGNTAGSAIEAKIETKGFKKLYSYLTGLTERDFKNNKAIEKVHNKIVRLFEEMGEKGIRPELRRNYKTLDAAKGLANRIHANAKLSLITDCFDADGKLIAEKTKDGVGAIVKKVAGRMNMKKAGWYGVIGAALGGFLVWSFASENKDNALQKLKKEVMAS